jgi:hypothetical protein
MAVRNHWSYVAASWLATQGFVALSWVLFLPTAYIPLATRLAFVRRLFSLGVTL